MQKGSVLAHLVFAASLIVTAVLAAVQSFGPNVLASPWARLATAVSLAGAVYLGSQRDFYMPFLGPCAMPASLLKLGTPADAPVSVEVDAPRDATHVVYWAATSGVSGGTPRAAYRGFQNSGVVAVEGGRAQLQIASPGTYKVAWGRMLPKHVHYRFVFANGIMSSVKTAMT